MPNAWRDVGEVPAVVAEEDVGTVAEGDVEIQVAIAIHVDEGGLAYRARIDGHAGLARHVGEVATVVAIEAQHAPRASGESDEEIGITVAVEVPPRHRARGARVGDAGLRGDVLEAVRRQAVESVGGAIEADEEFGGAIAVDVTPGVGQRATIGEALRLDRGERRQLQCAGPGDTEQRP